MLVILDGWGLAPAGPANALSVAKVPNFTHLWSAFPHLKLAASGEAVGLPRGQIGNSEVGHLNIGAGRVVLQDLPKINETIADGTFYQNKALISTLRYARENHRKLHLVGLVSPGGVHSHEKHLFALLGAAREHGVHEVYIHAITDGRDVDPHSGISSIEKLEKKIRDLGVGKIATVCGRYYAMDRDHRWDRTKAAYDAMVSGKGDLADTAEEAITSSYQLGVTDEFIRPTVIDAQGLISDGDAVVFFNFRSDRPRQLSRALVSDKFSSFKRDKVVKKLYFTTMAEYDAKLPVTAVMFPFQSVPETLSDVISEHGLTQFHIAETEKYAHVTYFLNGGNEYQEKGEDRMLVQSPKVATYDLQPEMSARGVTKALLEKIGKFDFIVVNYANPDMVGHTGLMKAAVKAAETVDDCLGQIVEEAYRQKYEVIIIADHGNIEKMAEVDSTPYTAHTTNPVPFILVSSDDYRLAKIAEPNLANVAPTVLELMGLPIPQEMTAKSLVKDKR